MKTEEVQSAETENSDAVETEEVDAAETEGVDAVEIVLMLGVIFTIPSFCSFASLSSREL